MSKTHTRLVMSRAKLMTVMDTLLAIPTFAIVEVTDGGGKPECFLVSPEFLEETQKVLKENVVLLSECRKRISELEAQIATKH